MTGATFSVPADHPALPGHFPGRPLVPGVLLLDAVLRAAAPTPGRPVRVLRARFTAPVLPGEAVAVEVAPADAAGRRAFACRGPCGTLVLSGELA